MVTEEELKDFSFYNTLSQEKQKQLQNVSRVLSFQKGEQVYNGTCMGLILVKSGRLRVYTISAEGREITLYRLSEGDVCLFSASCALHGIGFEVSVSAETSARLVLIPSDTYEKLSQTEISVSAFTNQLMSERFSQVMWVLDEVLNKKFASRLAKLLLQESDFSQSDSFKITHEQLAAHLGTVREAVSRMLKYFEEESAVRLTRGTIQITDKMYLQNLAEE